MPTTSTPTVTAPRFHWENTGSGIPAIFKSDELALNVYSLFTLFILILVFLFLKV